MPHWQLKCFGTTLAKSKMSFLKYQLKKRNKKRNKKINKILNIIKRRTILWEKLLE